MPGNCNRKHLYSKKQGRYLFAAEKRGEVPKGTARHHMRMSKKEGRPYSKLPEKVKKRRALQEHRRKRR